MFKLNSIASKIDELKPFIWGLFASSIIAKHAVGNIILIGIGILFLLQILVEKRINLKKEMSSLLIYFAFGAISLLWTTNLSTTYVGISKGFYFVLIPLFLSQYSNFTLLDLRKMLRITGISLLLYFFFSLFNSLLLYLKDSAFTHFFYHDLTQIFDNNAIYISFLTSIVLLILFNLKNKTKIDNLICGGLVIYLLMLLSKNLIVTTFLIQLIFSYGKFKSKITLKSFIFFLAVFTIIIVPLLLLDNPLKERFMEHSVVTFSEVWTKNDFFNEKFNGLTLRMFQWRVFGEIIFSGNLFFLGLGWNNVDYMAAQYFNYYNFYAGYFDINFHNQYLQTFGELGVVGFLILVNLLFSPFFKSRKNSIYFILFISISAFSFFTESYLNRQKGIIIFLVFYCILMSLNKKGNNLKDENVLNKKAKEI